MQDFAPFIPDLRLDGAVHINLPATFQFSSATSKSIDIPEERNKDQALWDSCRYFTIC